MAFIIALSAQNGSIFNPILFCKLYIEFPGSFFNPSGQHKHLRRLDLKPLVLNFIGKPWEQARQGILSIYSAYGQKLTFIRGSRIWRLSKILLPMGSEGSV